MITDTIEGEFDTMNRKTIISILISQFFIIYTASMLVTLLFVYISNPTIISLPTEYLWQVALFSLAADLITLVYYSKNELSRKQFWIRTVIHTVLLEIILMIIGYRIGMYSGFFSGCLMVLIILVVDAFVRFITYLSDRRTADIINEKLKIRREEREKQ